MLEPPSHLDDTLVSDRIWPELAALIDITTWSALTRDGGRDGVLES